MPGGGSTGGPELAWDVALWECIGKQCPYDAITVVDDWPMCQAHADIQGHLRKQKKSPPVKAGLVLVADG